jgi:hypothetical protein
MALRNEDKDWIRIEIKAAIEPLKPHGWRKTIYILREMGPLAAIIGIVVALLGITLSAVYQSVGHVKEETSFRTNAKDRLDKLDTDMVSLRALISSSQPLSSQNQKAAKELLAQARQKLVPPIPESVVAQAGNSFIEVAKADSKAWSVALDFVSYRSSQNQAVPLEGFYPFDSTIPAPITRYSVFRLAGAEPFKLATSKGRIPVNLSARLEPIGQPQKQDGPDGPASLLLMGGAVVLDGMYGRHVIFKDAEIHYNGGPVILDQVAFIDCRFVVDNGVQGRQLASNILSSPQVTFKTEG